MQQNQVSKVDFIAWKNDVVTKAIFAYLREAADVTMSSMTSAEHLNDPNGLLRLNRMRGYVDGIEDMLHIGDIFEAEE